MLLLTIIICICIFAFSKYNKKDRTQTDTNIKPSLEYEQNNNTTQPKYLLEEKKQTSYATHYQAKYLLTRNEWYEYRKLRDIAVPHDLQICPKVRLLDIVEPRRGEGYMSLLGKIQSKHVDFVITDKDLRIKAILELDDGSHDKEDRKERDSFVDEILTGVGYIVIRTRSITENTLDPIIKTTQ